MTDSGPFLCGPRAPGPEDLAIVAEFRRQLEDSWASANNPDGLCRCGHPWGIHDVDEHRGDGSEMCCVTGCEQTGCPGRRRKATTMCAGCLVKPLGHEGECYQ
jgi:hypothetical protein